MIHIGNRSYTTPGNLADQITQKKIVESLSFAGVAANIQQLEREDEKNRVIVKILMFFAFFLLLVGLGITPYANAGDLRIKPFGSNTNRSLDLTELSKRKIRRKISLGSGNQFDDR